MLVSDVAEGAFAKVVKEAALKNVSATSSHNGLERTCLVENADKQSPIMKKAPEMARHRMGPLSNQPLTHGLDASSGSILPSDKQQA